MKVFSVALFPVVMPLRITVLVLSLLVLLAACAAAPTQEMSDARQSVQAAHDAGADKFASQNLSNAEEYLKKAERELELRFFSRARHDAIVAKSEALKAQNVALVIKEAQAAIAASAASPESLSRARALLQQAIEAAAQGKTNKAMELAAEARRHAGTAD